MTVISLTRGGAADAAGATPPRRRRGRVALARIGGGLVVLVPIVFLASFITYCLGALSNSNPAATILGQDAATPAAVARYDKYLGLDHPLLVQYWNWLVQAVHGNLGRSYFTQIPVSQSIASACPSTCRSRSWPSSWRSSSAGRPARSPPSAGAAGSTAGSPPRARRSRRSRPSWSASSWWSCSPCRCTLFPANGYVGPTSGVGPWLSHIFLPSLALSLAVAADIARQLRTSLVQVLEQNYIVGARVRGLPYRRILVRHALRNATGPALVILGNDFPQMLAGAVAAEVVFSLPGLGQLLLESAQTRDIPVVQGLLLVISTFVIVVNLVVNTTLNWLYRTDDGVST